MDHPLVTVMQGAVRAALEEEPVMGFMPAWTDGGLLYGYGNIPSVVLGPGEVEPCHSNFEHIPVDHLPKATLIYALTAVNFCHS